MKNDFDNKQPIFQQIIDKLTASIARGELAAGAKVASVRDLAIQYGVNPNTMQKSLAKMEDMGLLYTERTSGRFVTTDAARIAELGRNLPDGIIRDFVGEMTDFGIELREIPARVSDYIGRMEQNGQNTGN